MDFRLTEEQLAIQQTVRRFVRKEVLPVVAQYDKQENPKDRFPWELIKKASALGLRTCTLPKEWGGQETCLLDRVIICEELGAGDAGFGTVMGGMMKNCYALSAYLNKEQKEEFFPQILNDDTFLVASAVTEPDSATEVHLPVLKPGLGMKTFAYRDGDEYVINGRKHFITAGGVAKLYMLYARTDKEKPVNQAVSGFLVPRGTPGFEVDGFHDMLGKRLQGQGSLVFEDCRVPARYRIGEESKMFQARADVWVQSKLTTLSAGLGEARTCYEETKQYARERIQGGQPLIEYEQVGCRIADMHVWIEAARALLWKVAWSWDTKENYDKKLVYLTKAYVNEIQLKVVENAMEIYAGYGAQREYPVERHLRNMWNAQHGGSTPAINRIKAATLFLEE